MLPVKKMVEGCAIELSPRQVEIVHLVRRLAPITGEQIAEQIGLSRPTIRSDLAVLVMLGYLDAKPKVGYFLGKAASGAGSSTGHMASIKVKDIKAMPVIVRENTSVHDAVVTLFLENVGSLIVADEDNILQGFISRKDLLKGTLGNVNTGGTPVSVIMTRHTNVVTVTDDVPIVEAGRLMLRHDVDSLPVVQEAAGKEGAKKTEVVGRVSKTHIMKALLENTIAENASENGK